MKWNYRLIDRSHHNNGEDWFEIVEVYYEDDGSLKGFSSPMINGESRSEVISNLRRILADLESSEVLGLADFGLSPVNDRVGWDR